MEGGIKPHQVIHKAMFGLFNKKPKNVADQIFKDILNTRLTDARSILKRREDEDKLFEELAKNEDLLRVLKKNGKPVSYLESTYPTFLAAGAGVNVRYIFQSADDLDQFIQMEKKGKGHFWLVDQLYEKYKSYPIDM